MRPMAAPTMTPLHEVGNGLVGCQRKADVQVDIVVDREGADREKAR